LERSRLSWAGSAAAAPSGGGGIYYAGRDASMLVPMDTNTITNTKTKTTTRTTELLKKSRSAVFFSRSSNVNEDLSASRYDHQQFQQQQQRRQPHYVIPAPHLCEMREGAIPTIMTTATRTTTDKENKVSDEQPLRRRGSAKGLFRTPSSLKRMPSKLSIFSTKASAAGKEGGDGGVTKHDEPAAARSVTHLPTPPTTSGSKKTPKGLFSRMLGSGKDKSEEKPSADKDKDKSARLSWASRLGISRTSSKKKAKYPEPPIIITRTY
jgi:hypothetical protein